MPVRFKRKLIKVGGSYRVAIPPEIIEVLGWKINDKLRISLTDGEDGILVKKDKEG